MSDSLTTIIARVHKLLALAGNNSNENEALAALEKAHAILAEYNLTMADIGDQPETISEDQVRDSLHTETNQPERYNRWVWNAVAKANSCFAMSHRPNPKRYRTIYTLVGRRVNTIVATHMALYLCQTMKRLCSEHCKSLTHTRADGTVVPLIVDHAYKNAYMVGMASRLCARLSEMKKKAAEASGTGNALILWSAEEDKANEAFAEAKFGFGKTRAPAIVRYNATAMARGKADADKVSLVQQVGAAARASAAIGN